MERGGYAIRLNATNVPNWWRERRRQKQKRKNLTELPSHLLRDVSLKHLIDLEPDSNFDRH